MGQIDPVCSPKVQDFCIFRIQYLKRLWYAKVLSEPLATIKQYRISFNRMVVNDHFIREGHTYDNFPPNRGKLSHHIQLHEKWYPNSIEQKY